MSRKLGGLTIFLVLLSAWAASAQTIYGSAYNGANGLATLYSISPTTGAATPIGPISNFLQVGALAFAPNGTLYGISNSSSGGRGNAVLLTINTTTGAGTLVGDTGVTDNFNDLAFRSDGTLFGIARHGRNLYTINTTMGLATLVGSAVLGEGRGAGNGLAFSSANVLYTADQSELDVLNQSTGVRTPVVALNYSQFSTTLSRVNGMKFDPSTGRLYASVATFVTSGQQAPSFGIVNISTGVVTRIGPTVAGLDAIAISDATWQPSGWVFVVDDYVYALQDAVWRFILRTPSAGPWSYSFTTGTWANLLVGGWNYVLPAGPGTYYYYNLSAAGWYFLSLTPGQLWVLNLATGQWGTVY